MEPQRRLELVDLLLEEATQQITILERVTTAQGLVKTEGRGVSQGKYITEEQDALLEECAWWEQARRALTGTRNALEQIAWSEQQRGVRTRAAGA